MKGEDVAMFVSFKVENTGPFKDANGITTIAEESKKELLEDNTFEVNGFRYNKISYLIGPNGSGKTNYLIALSAMQKMIVMSSVLGSNNDKLLEIPALKRQFNSPIENFKYDLECNNKAIFFEIQFVVESILYTYSFAIQDSKILQEKLTKKRKRTEVLINRTSPKYEDIIVKSELSSFKPMISVVREDSLCLAMAAMLNNPLAQKIVNEIMSYRIINMASVVNAPEFNENNTSKEYIERYLKYLKIADPTLTNLKIDLESKLDKHSVENDDFGSKEIVIKNIQVNIQSSHPVFKDHEKVDDIELPFLKYESSGTIRLLRILPAIFNALDNGETLFIDEIDNGLHPKLVQLLIDMFNLSKTNPNNAQLVCTTHNLLFLNNVRRDQVWFTNKNQFGETTISRLSNFPNVRSNDNIFAKYMQGVFGGIPNIPEL